MDVNQEIIPHVNQMALDYANHLDPCYRFCPTDSELILHCLIPKIESRNLPRCQLHEVDIYNHNPHELAERYLCGQIDKWYFLTQRKRIYANGDRPKRGTRDFGTWKATQCKAPVYDDATRQMIIGHKASLTFHDNHVKKTVWLMHEYTTNRLKNTDKFNDWALCTIYKHETKKTANSNQGEVVLVNPTIQEDVIKERNAIGGQTSEVETPTTPAVATEEPKETCYGPSPKRRRASKTHEKGLPSGPENVAVQESNCHLSVETNPYPNTMQHSDGASTLSIMEVRPPAQPLDYSAYTTSTFHGMNSNMFMSTTKGYQFTNGAEFKRHLSNDTFQENVQNSYRDLNQSTVVPQNAAGDHHIHWPDGYDYPFTSAAPAQPGGDMVVLAPAPVNSNNFLNQYQDSGTLLGVQNSLNQSMVVPQNAAGYPHIPSPDGYDYPFTSAAPAKTGGYMAVLAPAPVSSNNFLNEYVQNQYQDSGTLLGVQNSLNQLPQNAADCYSDPDEFCFDEDFWESTDEFFKKDEYLKSFSSDFYD